MQIGAFAFAHKVAFAHVAWQQHVKKKNEEEMQSFGDHSSTACFSSWKAQLVATLLPVQIPDGIIALVIVTASLQSWSLPLNVSRCTRV